MPFTVAQLAEICGGVAAGDASRLISGANSLENATASELSFAANKKALAAAAHSQAGCLLVPLGFDAEGDRAVIAVSDPRSAFVRALAALYPGKISPPGVHHSAVVAAGAQIASDCSIGAHVTIGERVRIASGCRIGNNCSIGDGVSIGPDSILHAGVMLYDGVKIGARAVLHSGCVIGADGFGFTIAGDRYEKFPQVGTVELGDDVEIGANSCVDRAALGITFIGNGTKLDNLVHVAHNCVIGKHVVVAAQTGFSGSVTVEDFAVIGGQAGIGEKARIKSKAVVGGKSGVLTSQTIHAGEPVWGIPARPLRSHLKNLAYIQKLPGLNQQVRQLGQRVTELEAERG